MSRRTFTQGSWTIHAIGWDPGLATFFLQLNAQHEEPWLWLGTQYGECPEPEPLVARLREAYAPVPDNPAYHIFNDEGVRVDAFGDPWPDDDEDEEENRAELALIPTDLADQLRADREADPAWKPAADRIAEGSLKLTIVEVRKKSRWKAKLKTAWTRIFGRN
jgi:hypothetical protein